MRPKFIGTEKRHPLFWSAANRIDILLYERQLPFPFAQAEDTMTDKELRRLSRVELIRLLLEQTRECELLRQELEQAKQALEDRRILLSEAGSIAEASLRINQVLETVQQAADQYLENVERTYQERAEEQYAGLQARIGEMETAARKRCAQMLEEARRKADGYGGNG